VFNLRNRKFWLIFAILLLTIVSINEPSGKVVAENKPRSKPQSPVTSPKTLGIAQEKETPGTLIPFNGMQLSS